MNDVDPRVAAALEHLQRAALELIAAARNALDVAEDLARDPGPLQALVEGVLLSFGGTGATGGDDDEPAPADPPVPARVQRIRVD